MEYIYTATIQRAIVGERKVITWSISEVPFVGYSIRNMDTDATYINHDGASTTSVNTAFRFLGDPKALTVQVEISNVNLEHGGYIVSAVGRVLGGTIIAVQGT